MPPDPAGRRTPRAPARGVAAVAPARPAARSAGTMYTFTPTTTVSSRTVARVVLAAAGMMTGMVGGGLLLGQAVANWMGV